MMRSWLMLCSACMQLLHCVLGTTVAQAVLSGGVQCLSALLQFIQQALRCSPLPRCTAADHAPLLSSALHQPARERHGSCTSSLLCLQVH